MQDHDVPRDRPIDVRRRADGVWTRVRWNPRGVTEVAGIATTTGRWDSLTGSLWLAPGEIDGWREPIHPPIENWPPPG